jgi:SAM-dependent methyltransferase
VTAFDRAYWENRWAAAAAEQGEHRVSRAPSPHLVAELKDSAPGLALDAGCGEGTNVIWLARNGWHVTAVDISPSALRIAKSLAAQTDAKAAERIDWLEADLQRWTPEPGRYDLVTSLYVHTPGPVEEMVQRLANGVAPGGTLIFIGHSPHEPMSGAESTPPGREVSVAAVVTALDPALWEIVVAEDRRRTGSAVDSVIRARQRDVTGHTRDRIARSLAQASRRATV